jgi:hypothetical protein
VTEQPTTSADQLTVEERIEELARLVDEAARLLGRTPDTLERGCQIAARAWWLARPHAPAAARRLNATLHRLAAPERNPH